MRGGGEGKGGSRRVSAVLALLFPKICKAGGVDMRWVKSFHADWSIEADVEVIFVMPERMSC